MMLPLTMRKTRLVATQDEQLAGSWSLEEAIRSDAERLGYGS